MQHLYFAQTTDLDTMASREAVRDLVLRQLKGFRPRHTAAQRVELAKLLPEHEFQGEDVESVEVE
jgi:hypothetical protein